MHYETFIKGMGERWRPFAEKHLNTKLSNKNISELQYYVRQKLKLDLTEKNILELITPETMVHNYTCEAGVNPDSGNYEVINFISEKLIGRNWPDGVSLINEDAYRRKYDYKNMLDEKDYEGEKQRYLQDIAEAAKKLNIKVIDKKSSLNDKDILETQCFSRERLNLELTEKNVLEMITPQDMVHEIFCDDISLKYSYLLRREMINLFSAKLIKKRYIFSPFTGSKSEQTKFLNEIAKAAKAMNIKTVSKKRVSKKNAD